MVLTPEQLKASLASLTPSDVKKAVPKKVKPLIEPSTTTPTTEIMPQVTSVQPLSPKQNIMSPSLEVQAGVQPEKDYKALATPEEKSKVIRMLQAGTPEATVRAGFRQAIDRRLTQENNARGQEPKNYVDQNNMPIYNGDLSLKGGVQGVQGQLNKGERNDQLIPQAKPTFAYTEGDIAKGGTTGFKNLGKMIGNAPASIYNVGANVGNMILNPIDTAEGLASLVGGVATKGVKGVVNALGGDGNKIQSFIDQKAQEPGVLGYVFNTLSKGDDNASMLSDALVDRYGSIDKLTKTVVEDPAGFVSDVSTIVGGASSLASKGAKVAGETQLASNLQKVSTAMDAIDPYTQIPKAVNKAALSVAKPIAQGVANVGVSALGKMTGTSADTIKQVYKSAVQGSDEAREGLRGNINDQDVLTSVQRGVEAIKDDRNLAYGNDYKILKANTNKLDIRNIGLETLQSMYDDLGVSVDKQGKLDFSQSKITSKAAQSNLQEIITDIKNWKDKTPAGLDILKQRVQDYYRGMPEYAKSDRFSTMVSNKIKDLIVKEVPEYAKMQENYGKMQSILSDIKSAISVGGKAGNSTIITKLKGVLRDNQEFRQAMVRKLEEYSGKDVMGQIAGLQMNPVLPKGLVGAALGAGGGLGYLAGTLTNPATLLGLLGTSPRLVGEFANAVGVSVNLINKVVEKAKSFIPDGNNGGSNSPSVLSKLNPTPDGGNNMKTSPIVPKKTPIIPTKTVTMDTKVVAPNKTVAPKTNNNLVEPKVETVLDQKAMDRIESRIYQEVGDFKTVNKYNPTTQSMGNLKTIFERIMKEPGAEQYLKSQGIKSAQSFSDYIHGINRQIRPGINKARSELYKVVDENSSSMKLNAGIEKAGMKGPFEYKDTTQLEKALEAAKAKKTIVPVKQEVVQSTTAPKKQSVVPKPQEKQAVLEGKKYEIKTNKDNPFTKHDVQEMKDAKSGRDIAQKLIDIYHKRILENNPIDDMSINDMKKEIEILKLQKQDHINKLSSYVYYKKPVKKSIENIKPLEGWEDGKYTEPTKAPVSKELQPLYEEAKGKKKKSK